MLNSDRSNFLKTCSIGRKGKKISFTLNYESLEKLIEGSLCCIWHKNWYDVNKAKSAISKLQAFGLEKKFKVEKAVNIGLPIGSLLNSQLTIENYVTENEEFLYKLRNEFFDDCQNPIDALFQKFDEVWTGGAVRGTFQSKNLSPGIFRWFKVDSSLNPHVDQSAENVIASFCSRARLTANTYLNTVLPESGGQLELWDLELNYETYEQVRLPDFSLSREKIPLPALSISPAAGDLIIFNAERIHAVSCIKRGERITASSFIGISDPGKPAVFFG